MTELPTGSNEYVPEYAPGEIIAFINPNLAGKETDEIMTTLKVIFATENHSCEITDSNFTDSVLLVVEPNKEEILLNFIREHPTLSKILVNFEKRDIKSEIFDEYRNDLIKAANNIDPAKDADPVDTPDDLENIRLLAGKMMKIIAPEESKNETLPNTLKEKEYTPEYAPGEFDIYPMDSFSRELIEVWLKYADFKNEVSFIYDGPMRILIDPENEEKLMKLKNDKFNEHIEGFYPRDLKKERISEFFRTIENKFKPENKFLEQNIINDSALYKYLGDIEKMISKFRQQIANNLK